MTAEKIIALAKEKLGKNITEQEAQDYLDGKIALPDEALDVISGGDYCRNQTCPKCGGSLWNKMGTYDLYCDTCGYEGVFERKFE